MPEKIVSVTVLMPIYNGETYLRECIEGVLSQTFSDFELLIIDDGSSDGSDVIYRRFSEADRRIRIFKKENGGISSALNMGIKLAKGEFIARIDSDDIMLPTRLQTQYSFLKANMKYGFCSSAMDIIDARGDVRAVYHPVPTTDAELTALLAHKAAINFTHPTIMMRRKLACELNGYDRSFEPCEDGDLFCRMIVAGKPGLAIPQVLTQYRMHSGSISGRSAVRQTYAAEIVRVNLYRQLEGKAALKPYEWQTVLKSSSITVRLRERLSLLSIALRQMARYERVSGYVFRSQIIAIIANALRPHMTIKIIVRKLFAARASQPSMPMPQWRDNT